MFNKMPYDKGRWYRAFIESNGNDCTVISSDLKGVGQSGQYLTLPQYFHTVDVKHDINCIEGGTANNVENSIRLYANGSQGVMLPQPTDFDWCYIYIFGYFA